MKELRVRDIMSTELVTLDEDEDLTLADTIMNLARIRHLPVVRDGELVGLVTHRDLLRAQTDRATGAGAGVPASGVMTTDVETTTPDTAVLAAARTIESKKLGCLPVVEDGRLVGIVTEADFVRVVIEFLEGVRGQGGR